MSNYPDKPLTQEEADRPMARAAAEVEAETERQRRPDFSKPFVLAPRPDNFAELTEEEMSAWAMAFFDQLKELAEPEHQQRESDRRCSRVAMIETAQYSETEGQNEFGQAVWQISEVGASAPLATITTWPQSPGEKQWYLIHCHALAAILGHARQHEAVGYNDSLAGARRAAATLIGYAKTWGEDWDWMERSVSAIIVGLPHRGFVILNDRSDARVYVQIMRSGSILVVECSQPSDGQGLDRPPVQDALRNLGWPPISADSEPNYRDFWMTSHHVDGPWGDSASAAEAATRAIASLRLLGVETPADLTIDEFNKPDPDWATLPTEQEMVEVAQDITARRGPMTS